MKQYKNHTMARVAYHGTYFQNIYDIHLNDNYLIPYNIQSHKAIPEGENSLSNCGVSLVKDLSVATSVILLHYSGRVSNHIKDRCILKVEYLEDDDITYSSFSIQHEIVVNKAYVKSCITVLENREVCEDLGFEFINIHEFLNNIINKDSQAIHRVRYPIEPKYNNIRDLGDESIDSFYANNVIVY